MKTERLRELTGGFSACRIAVLGDYFLDKYLDVDPRLAEISLETGRTAHQVVSVRCAPGAAGTVVNNLAALGAGEVHTLGFIGDDGEGYELRRALQKLGCNIDGLLTLPGRFTPTYLKPRSCLAGGLSGEHERYDTKNRAETPPAARDQMLRRLESILSGLDAVIVQDQVEEPECGVVTAHVRERLAGWAERNPGKIFWADSRRRVGLIRYFIIKPNAREAVRQVFPGHAGAVDDELLARAMVELRRRTGKPVFVTSGERGIWVSDPQPVLVPGVDVPEPTDPTGAGDSATAGAVLALCAGAGLLEAALTANLVASITIQQLAETGTANRDQLVPRLELWRRQNEPADRQ